MGKNIIKIKSWIIKGHTIFSYKSVKETTKSLVSRRN